jgi:hypothetical protein
VSFGRRRVHVRMPQTLVVICETEDEGYLVNDRQIWIVTDGAVGFEAQATAVADAIGLPYVLKRVRSKGLMRFLPTRLQVYLTPRLLLRL